MELKEAIKTLRENGYILESEDYFSFKINAAIANLTDKRNMYIKLGNKLNTDFSNIGVKTESYITKDEEEYWGIKYTITKGNDYFKKDDELFFYISSQGSLYVDFKVRGYEGGCHIEDKDAILDELKQKIEERINIED